MNVVIPGKEVFPEKVVSLLAFQESFHVSWNLKFYHCIYECSLSHDVMRRSDMSFLAILSTIQTTVLLLRLCSHCL